MDTLVWSRFVTLGPVSASPGSRAFLAYENGNDGPLWPVVVVWVPEDVERDPDRMAALQLDTDRAVLLDHPNVNRVVGCEKLPEGWARVVELADGETMRRVLQVSKGLGRARLDPRLVARILADTAAGTHYVHERGKVEGSVRWRLHGSIKPETVIAGFDGVAKITGYGANEVAPRDSFGPRATLRSQYLSPEEIERGSEVTDRRSDVYALGLVLYEALAGRPPWATDDPAFEYKVLSEPLPLEPLQGAPDDLKEIAVKALARLPANRYATAGAMAEALEATGPAAASEVAAELARLFPPDGDERARRRKLLASAGFTGDKLPRPQPRTRAKPVATPAPLPQSSAPAQAPSPAASPSPSPSMERTAILPPRRSSDEPEPMPPMRRRGVPPGLVALAILGSAAAAGLIVYLATYHPQKAVETPAARQPSFDTPAPQATQDERGIAKPPAPPPVPAVPAVPDLPPAPAPAAAPVPPPLEPATVELSSEPSLAVTVDGVAKGSTPQTLELAPGAHTIHFRDRAQGIDLSRTVHLKPGGHAAVSVRPERAGMEVTAPAGSQVYLDGRAAGVAPVGTLHFFAGHHVIKVKMDKAMFERPFDAEAGETLTLDVHPEQAQ